MGMRLAQFIAYHPPVHTGATPHATQPDLDLSDQPEEAPPPEVLVSVPCQVLGTIHTLAMATTFFC